MTKINSLNNCVIQNSEVKAFLSNFGIYLQEYSKILEISKTDKISNLEYFDNEFLKYDKTFERICSDENTSERNLEKCKKFLNITLLPFLKVRKNIKNNLEI